MELAFSHALKWKEGWEIHWAQSCYALPPAPLMSSQKEMLPTSTAHLTNSSNYEVIRTRQQMHRHLKEASLRAALQTPHFYMLEAVRFLKTVLMDLVRLKAATTLFCPKSPGRPFLLTQVFLLSSCFAKTFYLLVFWATAGHSISSFFLVIE